MQIKFSKHSTCKKLEPMSLIKIQFELKNHYSHTPEYNVLFLWERYRGVVDNRVHCSWWQKWSFK